MKSPHSLVRRDYTKLRMDLAHSIEGGMREQQTRTTSQPKDMRPPSPKRQREQPVSLGDKEPLDTKGTHGPGASKISERKHNKKNKTTEDIQDKWYPKTDRIKLDRVGVGWDIRQGKEKDKTSVSRRTRGSTLIKNHLDHDREKCWLFRIYAKTSSLGHMRACIEELGWDDLPEDLELLRETNEDMEIIWEKHALELKKLWGIKEWMSFKRDWITRREQWENFSKGPTVQDIRDRPAKYILRTFMDDEEAHSRRITTDVILRDWTGYLDLPSFDKARQLYSLRLNLVELCKRIGKETDLAEQLESK